jgi:hypothetical protein
MTMTRRLSTFASYFNPFAYYRYFFHRPAAVRREQQHAVIRESMETTEATIAKFNKQYEELHAHIAKRKVEYADLVMRRDKRARVVLNTIHRLEKEMEALTAKMNNLNNQNLRSQTLINNGEVLTIQEQQLAATQKYSENMINEAEEVVEDLKEVNDNIDQVTTLQNEEISPEPAEEVDALSRQILAEQGVEPEDIPLEHAGSKRKQESMSSTDDSSKTTEPLKKKQKVATQTVVVAPVQPVQVAAQPVQPVPVPEAPLDVAMGKKADA